MIDALSKIVVALLVLVIIWSLLILSLMYFHFNPECRAHGYDESLYTPPYTFYCVQTNEVITPIEDIYHE